MMMKGGVFFGGGKKCETGDLYIIYYNIIIMYDMYK